MAVGNVHVIALYWLFYVNFAVSKIKRDLYKITLTKWNDRNMRLCTPL